MIGKDMTKMTLPVSFNEPTSLLQRVTEDMVCTYFFYDRKTTLPYHDIGSMSIFWKQNWDKHQFHIFPAQLINVLKMVF